MILDVRMGFRLKAPVESFSIFKVCTTFWFAFDLFVLR